MNSTKKIISMILIVFMFLPSYVYANENVVYDNVSETTPTSIYWVYDEDAFNQTFNVASTECNIVYNTSRNTNNLYSKDITEIVTSYTFNIGENEPITVLGTLEEIVYGETKVLTGSFEGEYSINAIDYTVNAVIHKEISGPKLSAGITMIPHNAQSLDDYIFFAIGETVVTKEMLPDWILNANSQDKLNSRLSSANQETMRSSIYSYLGYDMGYFSSSGPAANQASQYLRIYKSPNSYRAAAAINTYVDNLNDHFSSMGLVGTTIKTLEVGLRRTSGTGVSIANIDNYSNGTTYTSTLMTSSFISYLVDLVDSVFGYSNSVLSTFELLLETIASDSSNKVEVSIGGSDTSAKFTFSTLDEISFDDAAMMLEFNLIKSIPSSPTASFCAYSNVQYYVTYIPTGTDTPVMLNVNGNSAQTGSYSITLN